MLKVTGFDHLVLCVADIKRTITFYHDILGMDPREERPGKWSLHFGNYKISLQDVRQSPAIARDTVPGSGNFCLLTTEPLDGVVSFLKEKGVTIVAGPGERVGATGGLYSVYFNDPDGNLVEVSNRLD